MCLLRVTYYIARCNNVNYHVYMLHVDELHWLIICINHHNGGGILTLYQNDLPVVYGLWKFSSSWSSAYSFNSLLKHFFMWEIFATLSRLLIERPNSLLSVILGQLSSSCMNARLYLKLVMPSSVSNIKQWILSCRKALLIK